MVKYLKRHNCSANKPHKCKQCDKSYNEVRYLKRHKCKKYNLTLKDEIEEGELDSTQEEGELQKLFFWFIDKQSISVDILEIYIYIYVLLN